MIDFVTLRSALSMLTTTELGHRMVGGYPPGWKLTNFTGMLRYQYDVNDTYEIEKCWHFLINIDVLVRREDHYVTNTTNAFVLTQTITRFSAN